MKAIDCAAPRMLADAVALLAQKHGRARVLAAGSGITEQLREHRCDAVVRCAASAVATLAGLRPECFRRVRAC